MINLSTLNPVSTNTIAKECIKHKLLVTVEEHSIVGGIGSIVSEVLAATDAHPRLIRIGTSDNNLISGNYAYMLEKNGLTAKDIARIVIGDD